MFSAIYLSKAIDNSTVAEVKEIDESELPHLETGAVTVNVDFSTINYKDGLAITGQSPIVRKFPMVPGIDFSGTVATSDHASWKTGDKVILNGWGVGEAHWGGLSQKARVSGDWLIRLPEKFSSFDAMAIGTAGYTAMLCVMSLEEQGIKPGSGEILVTGATGGVGSFAVSLLASLGYRVVASTGKKEEHGFLQNLGAVEIIDRHLLSAPGKPLQKERWDGVVDTVGSHTLANACSATRYGGVVTACGLAQGMDFPTTVAPFILRGIRLIGIDSVKAPLNMRVNAWSRLENEIDPSTIKSIARTVKLNEVLDIAPRFLSGAIRGRIVVDVN